MDWGDGSNQTYPGCSGGGDNGKKEARFATAVAETDRSTKALQAPDATQGTEVERQSAEVEGIRKTARGRGEEEREIGSTIEPEGTSGIGSRTAAPGIP